MLAKFTCILLVVLLHQVVNCESSPVKCTSVDLRYDGRCYRVFRTTGNASEADATCSQHGYMTGCIKSEDHQRMIMDSIRQTMNKKRRTDIYVNMKLNVWTKIVIHRDGSRMKWNEVGSWWPEYPKTAGPVIILAVRLTHTRYQGLWNVPRDFLPDGVLCMK